MKVSRVTSVSLVNDDGSALHPAVEEKAFRMMQGLQQDRVLGRSSPLNDVAALRVVASVMKRFDVQTKAGAEEVKRDYIELEGVNCG